MVGESSFSRTVDMLKKTMDVSLLRRRIISDNLANSDTPNFKRSTVSFEAMLGRAVRSEKQKVFPGKYTDKRHISFDKRMNWREVEARKNLDYLTMSKNNGNNVDPEQEMMDAVKNQMRYNLLVQAVSNEFQKVNIVLR